MLGRINATSPTLKTDDSGNMELSLTVCAESRYAAKQLVKSMKDSGKDEFSLTVTERKNPRSIDQNSLLWALLTIYAEAQGGGRRGSVQPEDIYIRMVEKYGICTFLMALPEEEPRLKSVFRVVAKVDVRDYNGKEMTVFKCYPGSSTYDKETMTQLIEGVFDELAVLGVDAKTSRQVEIYREDWRNSR